MKTLIQVILTASLLAGSAAGASVRVSAPEALKQATSKPQPVYSPIARQMKVTGRIEVEAEIGQDGSVVRVKALNGSPLLTQSAVAAVEKWKFTPFTADGKPIDVVVTFSFDFKP